MVKSWCFTISIPRSQVNVFRRWSGNLVISRINACTTDSVSFPSNFAKIGYRALRSTSVAMWEFLLPEIKSAPSVQESLLQKGLELNPVISLHAQTMIAVGHGVIFLVEHILHEFSRLQIWFQALNLIPVQYRCNQAPVAIETNTVAIYHLKTFFSLFFP